MRTTRTPVRPAPATPARSRTGYQPTAATPTPRLARRTALAAPRSGDARPTPPVRSTRASTPAPAPAKKPESKGLLARTRSTLSAIEEGTQSPAAPELARLLRLARNGTNEAVDELSALT